MKYKKWNHSIIGVIILFLIAGLKEKCIRKKHKKKKEEDEKDYISWNLCSGFSDFAGWTGFEDDKDGKLFKY